MINMAEVEENQSSPSESRTRSQYQNSSPSKSEEQSLEQEISQAPLLFRIRIPSTPMANRRTPIHQCSVCGYNFSSAESLSNHMQSHWDSSSSSDTETEPQEFIDLSKYLPRWPVTGRRGRCNIIGMRENQEIEAKKSTSESGQIGNRVYHENKLTIRESNSVEAKNLKQETESEKSVSESRKIGKRVYTENKLTICESNSVKAKNLKRETEGKKSVSESRKFGNKVKLKIGESNSAKANNLKRETEGKKSVSKSGKIGNRVKLTIGESTSVKAKNLLRKGKPKEVIGSDDDSSFVCFNDPEEASKRPEISGSMRPKVFAFDLNDLPPMDQEDDATE